MNNLVKYSILQISPSRERQEIVNIGLILLNDNNWDVRVLPSPEKILALNPSFRVAGLVNTQKTIKKLLEGARDFDVVRQRLAKHGNDPRLHSFIGQFQANGKEQYEKKLSDLMCLLVIPPAQSKARNAARHSRLNARIRGRFKELGILGGKQEDIEKHKVVERFPVAPEKGLYAEFALRNGVMNFTETIDFEVQDVNRKILEAQAKAMVLSQAREFFGSDAKRYVVVSGSGRPEAFPSITLLAENAKVFEMQRKDEMEEYFNLIKSAAAI